MDSQLFDRILIHLYRWRFVVDECYHSTKCYPLLDIKLFKKDKYGNAILSKASRCLSVLMKMVSQGNKKVCRKFQEYVCSCNKHRLEMEEDEKVKHRRDKKGLGLKEVYVIAVHVNAALRENHYILADPEVAEVILQNNEVAEMEISDVTLLDNRAAEIILQDNYFHWFREDDNMPSGSQKIDVFGSLGKYADMKEYSVMDLVQDYVSDVFGELSLNISHVRVCV